MPEPVEKIIKSLLLIKEDFATIALVVLLVIAGDWIANVYHPSQLAHDNDLIKILTQNQERLYSIELILKNLQ